jgi:hypothetical protein
MQRQINSSTPTIALIIAWVFVIISYYLETRWGNSLFSRSGSMMVLLTVVAKQMLLNGRNKYHHQQLKTLANGKQANFEMVHPTKTHQYLEFIANINILIGTVIWGYGDLLSL